MYILRKVNQGGFFVFFVRVKVRYISVILFHYIERRFQLVCIACLDAYIGVIGVYPYISPVKVVCAFILAFGGFILPCAFY